MTPERGELKSRPMLGSCSIKGNSPFKKIYAANAAIRAQAGGRTARQANGRPRGGCV